MNIPETRESLECVIEDLNELEALLTKRAVRISDLERENAVLQDVLEDCMESLARLGDRYE